MDAWAWRLAPSAWGRTQTQKERHPGESTGQQPLTPCALGWCFAHFRAYENHGENL